MNNDPLGLFDEDANADPLGLFDDEKKNKFDLRGNNPEKAGAALTGLGQAGASLLTGIASGLAAVPVSAARAALYGEGDVKQGADAFAERNTYEPKSAEGQQIMENLTPILEGMQGLGPMDPFHGLHAMAEARGKAAAKAAGAKEGGNAPMPGVAQIPGQDVKAVLKETQADAELKARIAKLPAGDQLGLFTDSLEGQATPYDAGQAGVTEPIAPKRARRQMGFDFGNEKSIEVDRTGEAVPASMDQGTLHARDEYARKIQEELDAMLAEEKKLERPNLTSLEDEHGQQSLFDQGDTMGQRNQFNAGDLGDWRIDENGMPVRADKSMEGQNVENPLQRNLFGDELATNGLEGQNIGITQAIDNTPANGAWAQRRGMINRLGGRGQELPMSPELGAAALQAEGMKFPTLDTSMFEPKAPLPTERLGNTPMEPPRGLPEPPVAPSGPSGGPEKVTMASGNEKTIHRGTNDDGEPVTIEITRGKDGNVVNVRYKNPDGSQFDASGYNKSHTDQQIINGGFQAIFTPEVGHTSPSKVEIQKSADGKTYVAVKDGQVVGKLISNMSPEEGGMLKSIGEGQPANVSSVVAKEKGVGIGNSLYQAWKNDHGGDIAPSGQTTADAWRWWNRNEPDKVTQFVTQEANRIADGAPIEQVIGNINDPAVAQRVQEQATIKRTAESQTALSAPAALPPEAIPPRPDTVQTPRSPELIEERNQQRNAAAVVPSNDPRLAEFSKVKTIEEALHLAEKDGFKDNAPTWFGRNFGSGSGFHAIMTNNPVIKFINTAFRDAHIAQEQFSKKYVSDKKVGLTPMWEKMGTEERTNTIAALQEGDSRQRKITADEMTQLGFTEAQRNYVESYYAADQHIYDAGNTAKETLGMKPTPYREGHYPGIFKGGYKAMVTDGKGVTAVLATDSRGEMRRAIANVMERDPTAQITEVKRKGLGTYRNQSDIFSGHNDILALLAEKDPYWAEIQAAHQEAIKKGTNSIFNFNVHELSKKGIEGNEGNKPWLDAKENAQAAHEAVVQYLEEGSLHHALQVPLNDLKGFMSNPDIPMPKTKKFAESYIDHITGQSANNPVANAVNWAIDQPGKALGYGPRSTLSAVGAVKNRMSQVFMGFLNYPFTAAQMLQPIQTVAPMMSVLGGRLGNTAKIPYFMTKGAATWAHAFTELMTGKDLGVNALDREIVQYGVDRGLAGFSEMEKAYEGRNSKPMRAFNQVAEVNMKLGETTTRMPSFIATAHMLIDGGVPKERAMEVAENLTMATMFDYHAWERPQIYAKGGVVGGLAGALTTFKHAYIGNQVKLLQEAKGGPKGSGGSINPLPIVSSLLIATGLAGLSGMPGFDDLDNMYGTITDKVYGERKNIRDEVMSNLPEGVKTGYLSTMTGLALQSKFSSAKISPDFNHPAQVVSPQLAAAWQAVADGYEVLTKGDKQAYGNFLMDITPSIGKGLVESNFKQGTDASGNPNGDVLDRNQGVSYHRSPEEWAIRRATGLRSTKEMLESGVNYRATQAKIADSEATKSLEKDLTRGAINGKVDNKQGFDFAQRAGTDQVPAMIGKMMDAAKKAKQTAREEAGEAVMNNPTEKNMKNMKRFQGR